jgi:hypothetical protein
MHWSEALEDDIALEHNMALQQNRALRQGRAGRAPGGSLGLVR